MLERRAILFLFNYHLAHGAVGHLDDIEAGLRCADAASVGGVAGCSLGGGTIGGDCGYGCGVGA